MAINKVNYCGTVLIDLTGDTVSSSTLLKGETAHDCAGNKIIGTLTTDGSSKNTQCYQSYASVSSTSYTATSVKLTVEKTGTYKVSWVGWRNTTSGTSGSQLYINGSAYGSATTTFTNSYGQMVTLSNVSLKNGDEIVVRARARATSYSMTVANLLIQEI